jgi:hypothetical protein
MFSQKISSSLAVFLILKGGGGKCAHISQIAE